MTCNVFSLRRGFLGDQFSWSLPWFFLADLTMCILSIMRCQVPYRLIRICLHAFNFLMLASVISNWYMDGNAHDPAVQVLGHVRLVTLLFSLMEISFKCRAVCTATHVFLIARVNHNVFMNSGLSLCLYFRAPMITYCHWFISPIWCGSSFSGSAIMNLFRKFQVL
jgi:hypothetical protein